MFGHNSRVVDQYGATAESIGNGSEGSREACDIHHVERQAQHVFSRSDDLVGFAALKYRYPRSFCKEPFGNPAPDPTTTTSDDGDFARKLRCYLLVSI